MSKFHTNPETDLSPVTQMVFFLALGKYLLGPFELGPCEPTEYQKWKQKQEQEQNERIVKELRHGTPRKS
jgi:hypothetical protein